MGKDFRKNWKKTTGKGHTPATEPNHLLSLSDGLSAVSGSIVGGSGITVVASGDSLVISVDTAAVDFADISGLIQGAGGISVYASGAFLVIDGSGVSGGGSSYDHTDIDENFEFRSDHRIHWSNSAANTTVLDVGLGRDAAGVIRVYDGAGGFGDFKTAQLEIGGAARFTTSAEPSVAVTDWKLWSDGAAGVPRWKNNAGQIFLAINSGNAGLGVTVAGLITADYTSVNAALTAGNTILNVIGDTVEGASPTINASGITIRLFNDSQINMNTNRFLWTQTANLSIRGDGTIRYAYAADTTLFDFDGNLGKVNANGLNLLNASSASGILTDGSQCKFSDCTLTGHLILLGTRNAFRNSEVSQDIIIPYAAINNMVSNTHYGGGLVDNGSGTVLSDLLSF